MKKASILILLFSFHFAEAQYFEGADNQAEETQSSSYFESQPTPEYGTDAGPGGTGGNPSDPKAPIDDYLFLLPLLGMMVGSYYLLKNRSKYPS
ncbi:MAG TPA: hypothetical protein VL022_04660 [Moheibacter sp.]|nr:hypothetical protein [Moheibacter sp.]